jgi:hypothetical protein
MNQKTAKFSMCFCLPTILKRILVEISKKEDLMNRQTIKVFLENDKPLSKVELEYLKDENCTVVLNSEEMFYEISW